MTCCVHCGRDLLKCFTTSELIRALRFLWCCNTNNDLLCPLCQGPTEVLHNIGADPSLNVFVCCDTVIIMTWCVHCVQGPTEVLHNMIQAWSFLVFCDTVIMTCCVHCVRDLLKCFTTSELIQWKMLCQNFEVELKTGSANNPPTHIFNPKQENGAKRWTDLKNRVVEHVSCLWMLFRYCSQQSLPWVTMCRRRALAVLGCKVHFISVGIYINVW